MYPPLVCWGAKPGLRGIKSGTYEASSPACDGHLHTRPILLILPQFSRAVRKFWLNLKMGRSRGGRQGRLPLAAAGSNDEFGNHRFGFPNSAFASPLPALRAPPLQGEAGKRPHSSPAGGRIQESQLCPCPRRADCRTPWESSRGPQSSRIQIEPSDMRGGCGQFFWRGFRACSIYIQDLFTLKYARSPRRKTDSLQAPRPKNLRFLAETGEGAGRLKPFGFQVSPWAKLPTAQIADLSRGTWRGACFPVHPNRFNIRW